MLVFKPSFIIISWIPDYIDNLRRCIRVVYYSLKTNATTENFERCVRSNPLDSTLNHSDIMCRILNFIIIFLAPGEPRLLHPDRSPLAWYRVGCSQQDFLANKEGGRCRNTLFGSRNNMASTPCDGSEVSFTVRKIRVNPKAVKPLYRKTISCGKESSGSLLDMPDPIERSGCPYKS